VGFPIRKSADQSLFAAPHGLSQRTTSFIASQRQGIHRIPLWHLIALIIEDRSESFGPMLRQKDHLLQTYPRASRSSAAHAGSSRQSAEAHWNDWICFLFTMTNNTRFASPAGVEPNRERTRETLSRTKQGSPLRDPRERADAADLLVEPDGIEPTTSCLQSTRSPN
jgi:hypothetical protein